MSRAPRAHADLVAAQPGAPRQRHGGPLRGPGRRDPQGLRDLGRKDELEALTLLEGDLGAFIRLYALLSQIFDSGSVDLERRATFYDCLLPLELERARDLVNISKIKPTHHQLEAPAPENLALGRGEALGPTGPHRGGVNGREKALLAELIEELNAPSPGDLSDQDELAHVDVLEG